MSEGCDAGAAARRERDTPPRAPCDPRRTQYEPINLKSNEQAESERSSGASSPEGGAAGGQGSGGARGHLTLNPALQTRVSPLQTRASPPRTPHPPHHSHAQRHDNINGTMATMFQNLQSLASMQQSMPQMSQLAANLQGLTSMSSNPVVNSPLNLSVSAPGMTPPGVGGVTGVGGGGGLMPAGMPSAMPQLILASGQLVQGIQGAQLLIPTSQGIATQTILTIPVNHVNSNDQMVNLALNNGQVVSTSLANLQAMAQPHQLLNNTSQQTAQMRSSHSMLNPALSNALLNPIPNFISNGAANAQELLQALQQPQQNHSLLQTVPQAMQGRRSSSPRQEARYKEREQFPMGAAWARDSNVGNRDRESTGPAAAMNSINRLTATNGEITITTSHGGSGGTSSAGCGGHSSGSGGSGGQLGSPQHPPMKISPGSVKMSPVTHETEDLLADSPNQPTISQTSSNVVDGINLDDIKEFAKAFKLRRLGLGLTQTQVGQALSVTEGPAYSQSAICSALASQMLAAQLSTQQQNIFEKLDITPKSAQKIKPVLERWMREAEDRYASGQNHLTDFIGMEPSKKRKRRTSFTPQALELLNAHFERNTHPSGTEITGLAHQLGYEREVIRIWFCNKRQALKNTVRMMSKGMV